MSCAIDWGFEMMPEGVAPIADSMCLPTLGRQAEQFTVRERAMLLMTPGLGDRVVRRLEQAGFNSLESMRQAGLDGVMGRLCAQVGSMAIANRRRAIERALQLNKPRGTSCPC